MIIPIKGSGFINHGSGLGNSATGMPYDCGFRV